MSTRSLRVPIRDKPCLASLTTTFGRYSFAYDASGYITQMRVFAEDTTTRFFELDFNWVNIATPGFSGFVISGITRTSY